jgi:hypothetical protein
MVTTGIVFIIVGILASIGGIAIWVVDVVGTVSDSMNVRRELEAEVRVPGSAQVDLRSGRYELVALGRGLTRTVQGGIPVQGEVVGTTLVRAPFSEPTAVVTGPDGAILTLRAPEMSSLTSTPSIEAVSIAAFTVSTPGIHTVDVDGGTGSVQSIGVRAETRLRDTFDALVVGALIGFVGGALLFLGVVLLVVGLIRRARPHAA